MRASVLTTPCLLFVGLVGCAATPSTTEPEPEAQVIPDPVPAAAWQPRAGDPARLEEAHRLVGIAGLKLGVTLVDEQGGAHFALSDGSQGNVVLTAVPPWPDDPACAAPEGIGLALFDGDPIGLLLLPPSDLRKPRLELLLFDAERHCFVAASALVQELPRQPATAEAECALRYDDPQQVAAQTRCELWPETAGDELVTLTPTGLRIDAEGSVADPLGGEAAFASVEALALVPIEPDVPMQWGPATTAPGSTEAVLRVEATAVRGWLRQQASPADGQTVDRQLQVLFRAGHAPLRIFEGEARFDDAGSSFTSTLRWPLDAAAWVLHGRNEYPREASAGGGCDARAGEQRGQSFVIEREDGASLPVFPSESPTSFTTVAELGLVLGAPEAPPQIEAQVEALPRDPGEERFRLDAQSLCRLDAQGDVLFCLPAPSCTELTQTLSHELSACGALSAPGAEALGSLGAIIESDGLGTLRVSLRRRAQWSVGAVRWGCDTVEHWWLSPWARESDGSEAWLGVLGEGEFLIE